MFAAPFKYSIARSPLSTAFTIHTSLPACTRTDNVMQEGSEWDVKDNERETERERKRDKESE